MYLSTTEEGKEVQGDISYFSRGQEICLKRLFISELNSSTCQCLLPFWGRIYMIRIFPLLGKTKRTMVVLLLFCSTEFLTVQWYWPSWVTGCSGCILSKRKENWSCYSLLKLRACCELQSDWRWGCPLLTDALESTGILFFCKAVIETHYILSPLDDWSSGLCLCLPPARTHDFIKKKKEQIQFKLPYARSDVINITRNASASYGNFLRFHVMSMEHAASTRISPFHRAKPPLASR